MASSTNGIQPTPLSTETTFKVGNCSSMPERNRFTRTRAFDMNMTTDENASAWGDVRSPQNKVEPNDMDSSLAPTWKFTGRSSARQASQSGYQCGSPRCGRPCTCG